MNRAYSKYSLASLFQGLQILSLSDYCCNARFVTLLRRACEQLYMQARPEEP